MPTTFHEYFGDLYEECPTRQLIAGDDVIHRTWLKIGGSNCYYKITAIDLAAGAITGFDPTWYQCVPVTWSIVDSFGETGWLRKITEQPYDPTQMGDTEDDI